MRDCTSLEEVFDMLVMEQLINMMPSDLRAWIRERRPKSTLEAGELADQYMQARGSVCSKGGMQDKWPTERRRCHNYKEVGHPLPYTEHYQGTQLPCATSGDS